MVLPGHIAGGYLAAYGVLHALHPALTGAQLRMLFWWGAFFGIAPDFDYLRLIIMQRTLMFSRMEQHREFVTHTPIFWLLLSGGIFFLSDSLFFHYFALIVLVGSWSHLVLDSLEYGIMWLWPLSSRRFALHPMRAASRQSRGDFASYWWSVIRNQVRDLPWTFYGEIIIVLIGIWVMLRG